MAYEYWTHDYPPNDICDKDDHRYMMFPVMCPITHEWFMYHNGKPYTISGEDYNKIKRPRLKTRYDKK